MKQRIELIAEVLVVNQQELNKRCCRNPEWVTVTWMLRGLTESSENAFYRGLSLGGKGADISPAKSFYPSLVMLFFPCLRGEGGIWADGPDWVM